MTGSAHPTPLYAVALTRGGARVAARLAALFPGTIALAPARHAAEVDGVEGFGEPVAAVIARLWPGAGGFFLVMAAGIAVRSVASLLDDKTTDPAVVVLDSAGRFAVPILSGHLGGANDLAREAAARLGGTAVITTATDTAGRPAVEVWAREQGLRPEDRRGVVAVNAAWADGDPVGSYVDPALGPAALRMLDTLVPHLNLVTDDEREARDFSGVLLGVSHRAAPRVGASLLLRPPCLVLGVGCRRGADPETVETGVQGALMQAGLAAGAVGEVASVDAKRDEPALLLLARTLDAPYRTFSPDALSGIRVPTPSARVEQAVGTPSVAEAAALAAGPGALIVPKVKGASWTLAVVLRTAEVWMAPRPDAVPGAGRRRLRVGGP